MTFDYYYTNQTEQFQFVMIPRAMICNREFEDLSYAAKLLYALLRDKCTLSMKNGWVDDKKRVYIIYTIQDIMKDMGACEKMAVQYMKELETFGLIEKKRQGLGKPNLIFVKNFAIQDDDEKKTVDKENSRTSQKESSRTSQKESSELSDLEVQDLTDCTENNTNINQTYKNQNNNIHTEPTDWLGRYNMIENIINRHICLDELLEEYDCKTVNGLRDLIVEVMLSPDETMVIAKKELPVKHIQQKFLMISKEHVEYVVDWIEEHPTKIENPKKYFLTLLYNSLSTMEAYNTANRKKNYAS